MEGTFDGRHVVHSARMVEESSAGERDPLEGAGFLEAMEGSSAGEETRLERGDVVGTEAVIVAMVESFVGKGIDGGGGVVEEGAESYRDTVLGDDSDLGANAVSGSAVLGEDSDLGGDSILGGGVCLGGRVFWGWREELSEAGVSRESLRAVFAAGCAAFLGSGGGGGEDIEKSEKGKTFFFER